MKNKIITSAHNPQIKHALKLFKRRERDQSRQFLIEGYREVLRALQGGMTFHVLFYSPSHFLGVNNDRLIADIASLGVEVIEVGKHVFETLSYRDRPDGILAIALHAPLDLNDLDHQIADKKEPFFLVAESIEKPGNLGSILRSCDAVGADALILCDQRTDVYNPNVVRASVGTLFSVSVVQANALDALRWLKRRDIPLVASSPKGDLNFMQAILKKPIALAVGSEQIGLSSIWLDQADHCVHIPMRGMADSLNVSTAATLLLYEVMRNSE